MKTKTFEVICVNIKPIISFDCMEMNYAIDLKTDVRYTIIDSSIDEHGDLLYKIKELDMWHHKSRFRKVDGWVDELLNPILLQMQEMNNFINLN